MASATRDVGLPSTFRWDIVKAADSFVILASILAAFAFAALAILTTSPQHSGSALERTFAIQVLLEAFFTLVVASFLFAVLSGSEPSPMRYRPFAEGYAASWALGLSTLQLCASAVWLLRDYGVAAGVLETGRYIVYGAVVITSLSVIGVAVAPLFQHADRVDGSLIARWLAPGALPLVAVLFGWLAHGEHWIVLSSTLGSWLAVATVVAVLLMALATFIIECLTEQRVSSLYQSSVGYALLAASAFLLSALYAVYVATLPGLG